MASSFGTVLSTSNRGTIERVDLTMIRSYDDYCRAMVGNTKERNKAVLMSYVRSRLIAYSLELNEGENYIGLDCFEAPAEKYCNKDALSYILMNCREAIVRLTDSLRTKITRENKMTPVYRAREIDSSGISWICRRPGRNLREKLSGTRSVLAVQRRMSLDTGENRLVLAFVNLADKYIRIKQASAAGIMGTEVENDFSGCLMRFRAIEELEEIRQWENTPPNNTLLSDRNYRQVWNAWNEINNLDNLIAEDYSLLDCHASVILFADILAELRKKIRFPQLPVLVDYDSFTVDAADSGKTGLEGLDAEGNSVVFKVCESALQISYCDLLMSVQVKNCVGNIDVTKNGEVIDFRRVMLTPESFAKLASAAISCLKLKTVINNIRNRRTEQCGCAMICLTEPFPIIKLENTEPFRLNTMLAGQSMSDTYELSLADSRAIRLDGERTTFTIRTILKKAKRSEAIFLADILKKQLNAQRLVFLFPDIYNEFELSAVRSALRAYYRELTDFPESIAAVFSLLRDGQWDPRFQEGGFVVTAKLEGQRLAVTLLQSIPTESLENHGGIVWDRYPTEVYDYSGKINEICDKLGRWGLEGRAKELILDFGISALPKVLERLALFDCNRASKWFVPKDEFLKQIRSIKININAELESFKRSHARHLGGKTPLTIILTPALEYTANRFFCTRNERDLLSGYENFLAVSSGAEQSLWRDHLPRLAIKRFVGSFDLLDSDGNNENATIEPMQNKVQQITITNTFTLAAGKPSYSFQLIQGGVGEGLPFAAFISHKAFPLPADVECRLRLTYTYGSDNPYNLSFEPIRPAQAGFSAVKVEWIQMTEYPWNSLPCPQFPPKLSWEELAACPGKYGVVNYIEQAATHIDNLLKEQKEQAERRIHIPVAVSASDWREQRQHSEKKTALCCHYQWLNNVMVNGRKAGIYLNTRWFDERNDIRHDFDGFTCILEDQGENRNYCTLSLSEHGAKWISTEKGIRCSVHRRLNGEKQLITLLERDFEDDSYLTEPNEVSFTLSESPDWSRVTAKADYDRIQVDWSGNEYFIMPVKLPNQGEVTAFFSRGSFLFAGDFPPAAGESLSFIWRTGKNGRLYINNIVAGKFKSYFGKQIRAGAPPKQYTAKYVRTDNKSSYGPFMKRGLLQPLHNIFSDGRSMTEISCPDELRFAAMKLIRFMLDHYNECADELPGHIMFTALSLLASNIGEEYYKIASECVDKWAEHRGNVEYVIGFALGDLSNQYQKALLEKIETLPKDAIICIFSHAAWKNSQFIYGIETARLLDYFKLAVRCLVEMFVNGSPGARYHAKQYLEFILAVFRLRSLGDEQVSRILSLNSAVVRSLYECLEVIVRDIRDKKLERERFSSRLDMDVARSSEYQDIPPLLFAVIGCITGETGENDIRISGIESADDSGEE